MVVIKITRYRHVSSGSWEAEGTVGLSTNKGKLILKTPDGKIALDTIELNAALRALAEVDAQSKQ